MRLVLFVVLTCLWFPSMGVAEQVSAPLIRVTDDAGRVIELAGPAKRIVALAPHIVENLYSAGAGSRVVGAVEYSDFPPEAKSITRVGGYGSHSLEAIVALKPDLVVAWASGGAQKLATQLAPLGVTVYVSDPRSLADIAKSIRHFGQLAGTQSRADLAADSFLADLARLQQVHGKGEQLSVFYQVWHEPLQTLNDRHVISEVIRLCGGVNSFADAKVVAPKLSIESVISRNPDVIVASGMGESRPDWLDNWQAWPVLKAVQQKRLYFVPPDIIQRNTVRILEGAKLLCEHLDHARSQ